MERKDIANALSRVHEAAKKHGGNIVSTHEIERGDRELLVRMQWLQEIIRGWYMFARPGLMPGESSAWYANFWDFARIYLEENYGAKYCLSAESSIDLHLGKTAIPKQVIVIGEARGGTSIRLPFDTSILIYSDPKNFPSEQTTIHGLRVMTFTYAICKISPTWFQKNQADAEIALRLFKDPQELVYLIATHRFIRAGERIIGAYQAIQDHEKANSISNSLKELGISIKAVNPFEDPPFFSSPIHSPYEGRIRSLWNAFRPSVIERFPPPPGLPTKKRKFLDEIDEIYSKDAYNSLSIEGYKVDEELIQRVHRNDWNPDLNLEDSEEKSALAARGYYETFREVKKSIAQILDGADPGKVVAKQLQNWFQKLFFPSIQAEIIKPHELLGYRKSQVYIRNSRHVPMPKEALFDVMQTFFDCLIQETHPAVRAILGHFIFVYIHPYMDGNGRLGRFLMNAMFASGGYSWIVIQVKHRRQYFSALEKASVDGDINPFVHFIRSEMTHS